MGMESDLGLTEGIYIIRKDGVCFASTDNGTVTETDPHLISPFLDAVHSFTDINFGGQLKAIIIEDEFGQEKRVYFKKLKIRGEDFKIVAIFTKHKGFPWGDFKEIDSKMVKFKWIMEEKGWYKYLSSPKIPENILNNIEKNIKSIFRILKYK
ncbi:MAG: hypothetical protein ACTSVI_10965 [Promethearchaeota archaeon]